MKVRIRLFNRTIPAILKKERYMNGSCALIAIWEKRILAELSLPSVFTDNLFPFVGSKDTLQSLIDLGVVAKTDKAIGRFPVVKLTGALA